MGTTKAGHSPNLLPALKGTAGVPRCHQAEGRSCPRAWGVTGTEKALTSLLTVVKIDRDLSGQTCEETGIVGLMQGESARRANHSNHSNRRVSRAPGGKGVGRGAQAERRATARACEHGPSSPGGLGLRADAPDRCPSTVTAVGPNEGCWQTGSGGALGLPQEHDSTRHQAPRARACRRVGRVATRVG